MYKLTTYFLFVLVVGVVVNGTFQTPTAQSAGSTLRQVATVDLPGPPGERFDYLTTDDEDHYLLSAHLAAGILYVIDMRTNKLVKAIPNVPGVEGVEFVPELKKVYTSDWHENKIGIIDLRHMKVIKKIATEDKPDGSAYAAPFHKLYVSDERGKAEVVIVFEPTRSSKHYISIVRPECLNTIRSAAKSTSTSRTRT